LTHGRRASGWEAAPAIECYLDVGIGVHGKHPRQVPLKVSAELLATLLCVGHLRAELKWVPCTPCLAENRARHRANDSTNDGT
jgi:hypothetical protein